MGILFYMFTYVASGLLLRYSDGAVWQTVVTALVGPLGLLWWTLFQEKPRLHWHPEWTKSTTFAMLGLAVMTPGILLYKHLQRPRRTISRTTTDTTGSSFGSTALEQPLVG